MSNLIYHFSWEHPGTQEVHIRFEILEHSGSNLLVQLPAWRPGRYEIANFAKNIVRIAAKTSQNKQLVLKKQSKDSWEIQCQGETHIFVDYVYHAAQLNAGATWLDDAQLYVNPVNCCLYIPERIHEAGKLVLDLPESFEVACDLPKAEQAFTFHFSSFDRLADAPFIASASLKHCEFELKNHHVHLWFQGQLDAVPEKVITDFKAFCSEQLDTMGNLPGKEYHFMFQLIPGPHYHGVEHTYSTVCALGPARLVFEHPMYDEFLGVSSHELFHAWNVKTIRPADMLPYDFTQANYSQLGWVYEGVTTWYGDQFLLRSGVFDFTRYSKTFNEKLKRHFTNYGRMNMPVAEASFDTWLDGYEAGVPNRKTSIYVEGSLITFILDSRIRAFTDDRKSLDDFMRQLKEDASQGKGYTRERLIEILDQLAPLDHASFFTKFIEGKDSLEQGIRDGLNRLGLGLQADFPFTSLEHFGGFRIKSTEQNAEILTLAPKSPAVECGLMAGDQIVAINGQAWGKESTIDFEQTPNIALSVLRRNELREFILEVGSKSWYASYRISLSQEATQQQKQAYLAWSKQNYPA